MTYLLGLRLQGRDVLVVGGGQVAQRRVPVLLEAGARVTVVSPHVTTTLQGLAESGRIRWEQRSYRRGDVTALGRFWLVHAATDSAEVNAAVVAEAEEARIWSVRADDRHASSAWTPATGVPQGPPSAWSPEPIPGGLQDCATLSSPDWPTEPSTHAEGAPRCAAWPWSAEARAIPG